MASQASCTEESSPKLGRASLARISQWRFQGLEESYQREVVLVLTSALSLYLLITIFSFSPIDPSPVAISLPSHELANRGGVVGAYIAGSLFYVWGVLTVLLPLPFLTMATLYVARQAQPFGKGRLLGWLALFVSSAALLQRGVGEFQFDGLAFPIAGQVGELSFQSLVGLIGVLGHDILMACLLVCGLLMVVRKPFLLPSTRLILRPIHFVSLRCKTGLQLAKARIVWPKFSMPRLWRKSKVVKQAETTDHIVESRIHAPELIPIHCKQSEPGIELDSSEEDFHLPASDELVKEAIEDDGADKPKSYHPPSLNIFRSQDAGQKLSPAQQREFERTAASLIKALSDFHVEGEIVGIQPGPVVTVYEFQPKAGTKLSKVTGLMDDLALALKVDSLFIHPVSGTRALGIQVPNQQRQTVFLGDIFKSEIFQKASSPLTFAMGQSLSGDPICEDLASMPHLLTAGQTGSGKSVAINALLCSIILKAKPDEVKMILVDPKILELKVYEGVPHLLMPVITEASKASLALKWACHEMDRRYQLMELARVRHITGFNQFWQRASRSEKAEILEQSSRSEIEKLPYIVIVIDELADLMLTAPKDVESSIQRLAQKARACGIHLVLATQRPSVDVITGVIKANLPCRSSFKVFSRGDSRTILDCIGAEKLLGKGDMLFLKPGSSRLQRIQGAFLDDSEVVHMMQEIQSDSSPDYDEEAIAWIEDEFQRNQSGASGQDNFGDDVDDPKWDEALHIAQSQGHISASFLQRAMKIGYNRAARIVEAMEQQGLVAAADGSKPRKWLGPN